MAIRPLSASLLVLLGVVALLTGASCQTHRRHLSQKDGILPADFNDRLDAILPRQPFTLSNAGSAGNCQGDVVKSCKGALTVRTATFGTSRKYPVVLCTCSTGSYDTNGLANLIGRIPDYLLFFVKSAVSVPSSGNGAAATMVPTTGQMAVYGQTRARTLVHESGHAQDRAAGLRNSAFTDSSTWKDADAKSSCKATTYSSTAGTGEEYAEVVMILAHNYYNNGKYPAIDTKCLDPELSAIDKYTRDLGSGSGR